MKTPSMLIVAALALLPAPALADGPVKQTAAETLAAKAADRAEILAMAGNYKVRFDMQETTPWAAGYTPLDRKISGGNPYTAALFWSAMSATLAGSVKTTWK